VYRKPDFYAEEALIQQLWKDFKLTGKMFLKPGRVIRIFAPSSGTPTDMQLGWMPHEFAYPCVLYPTSPLLDGTGAPSGKLFAHQIERPDNPPNLGTFAIPSRGGKLVIPEPGKYFLFYDSAVDSSVECVVYDNTCDAAAHLLEQYVHHLRAPGTVSVLAAAATNILPGDGYRDGATIQNQGTVDIWVRPGTAALKPAAVGTGKVIPAGESMTWPNYSGPLNGRADGVNCNVWPEEIIS